MRQLIKLLITASLLSIASPFLATAADNPNILVMGEDRDEDSIPLDSRVFKRVINALSTQMHDLEFDVFDETAITLDNFKQGRSRRCDAELIDIAS